MDRKKNIFDEIGSLIPGFSGYSEREERRKRDKSLRSEIALILSQCEEIINNLIDAAIQNKDKEKIQALEINRKSINTLAARIKLSPYGVSAFFDNSQIKEKELEQIYKKDLEILERVNSFKINVRNQKPSEAVADIKDIDDLLEKRNQFIKEFK